jgi:hypothetical protein
LPYTITTVVARSGKWVKVSAQPGNAIIETHGFSVLFLYVVWPFLAALSVR